MSRTHMLDPVPFEQQLSAPTVARPFPPVTGPPRKLQVLSKIMADLVMDTAILGGYADRQILEAIAVEIAAGRQQQPRLPLLAARNASSPSAAQGCTSVEEALSQLGVIAFPSDWYRPFRVMKRGYNK